MFEAYQQLGQGGAGKSNLIDLAKSIKIDFFVPILLKTAIDSLSFT
jgi:hypothetical protein